jgi:3-oxoacyl-[acyl-carrier-protein] synthase-1
LALTPEAHRGSPLVTDEMIAKILNDTFIEFGLYQSSENEQRRRISSYPNGRAGLGMALQETVRVLNKGEANHIVLIAFDSYLNARDINAYLQENRLMSAGNSDGFIPGEAASAIVLHAETPQRAGLHIKGVAIGQEVGRPDGSVPSLGQGLTSAIRQACLQANIGPGQLHFQISDQNGEVFFSKDADNALTRIMFGQEAPKKITLSDKIGEVGAATGVAMLAWMTKERHNSWDNKVYGLCHLANDDGARAAVIIQNIQ